MLAAPTGALAEVFGTWQGEGLHVGRPHLFVRLAGCGVGCRFCDTPDALRRPDAFEVRGGVAGAVTGQNPVTPADAARHVAAVAAADGPFHRIAVTGGEPLEQPEFLAELLDELARRGAPPILLETAGTEPDALRVVVDRLATISMDLKLPSVARTAPAWDEHRAFLEIARGSAAEVYLKAVVSDALDDADWDRACGLVADVAPELPLYVQPETRRDGGLAARPALLARLATRARALGARDVRILPQVHKSLGID